MAIAIFSKKVGAKQKTACILVKKNPIAKNATVCYVPLSGVEYYCKEEIVKGVQFEIPDGYTFSEIVNRETGEVITAKDGSPLLELVYD